MQAIKNIGHCTIECNVCMRERAKFYLIMEAMKKDDKKKIKLFVSDIDGTLLNERSELEEETIGAICRFQKQGGVFMLATGRNSWEVSQVTDFIDDVIVNCVNGAMLCLENGNTIFAHFVDNGHVETIASLCDEYDTPVEFHGEKATYTSWKKEAFKRRAIEVFARNRAEDAELIFDKIYENEGMKFEAPLKEILKQKITKIEVVFMKDDVAPILEKRCKEILIDCNVVATSGMAGIEITSDRADKALAIRHYCEMRGIDEDEVAVVGDGENDIPMLRAFRNSYAMDNATGETKEAATYIALSNREKGAARLINEICEQNRQVK